MRKQITVACDRCRAQECFEVEIHGFDDENTFAYYGNIQGPARCNLCGEEFDIRWIGEVAVESAITPSFRFVEL